MASIDYDKYQAKRICNLIKQTFIGRYNGLFVSDDDITLLLSDLQITIDYDITYLRIHKNDVLQIALDLTDIFNDYMMCSKIISEQIVLLL